ncbi:MAG: ABC transporter permease subunit [Phycisphaerales bacterium]
MIGLTLRVARETRTAAILFVVGMSAVLGALTLVIPQILDGMESIWEQMPFIRQFVAGLLGVNMDEELTGEITQAFLWVHPAPLALLWAIAIMHGTRLPAGEIDRGTIDLLLGLPVKRSQAYLAETIVVLAVMALTLVTGALTHVICGAIVAADFTPSIGDLARIIVNFFAIGAAVAGLAFFVSSLCERRGVAVGIAFAIVLFSFIINFIAQFWEAAEPIAFLSLLTYYRPAAIVRDHTWPLAHLITLGGIALIAWLAGLAIFARRDISVT